MKKFLIMIIIPLFLLLRFDSTIISNNCLNINQNKLTVLVNDKYKSVIHSSILVTGTVAGNVLAGFTLAEVLITLLIIGVVASLVIPGLINDTQNQEYKTQYKKAYGAATQALKKLMQKDYYNQRLHGAIIPKAIATGMLLNLNSA